MSRIAAIFRAGSKSPQSDKRVLENALSRLPGSRIGLVAANGASLGRIAFDNADLGGGLAEHAGWLVALDGSIFNAEALAKSAHERADHAVLLAALLAARGPRLAMQKIAGDLAAAAYDIANDCLWLLRDRLGVKPLYWAKIEGGFACASQPRALLALPGVSGEVNRGFVARFAGMHYRTFDNIPEESPYAAIAQLPAGTCLPLSGKGVGKAERYWELGNAPDFTESEDELAQRYRELLLCAVGKRVNLTKNPSFTLSGGMDSSSVLCCAVETTGRKQHAVSSVYRDPTFDERHEIRDVTDEKVTGWSAVEIPEDIALFSHIDKIVREHDEPVATATWLSHDIVAAHTSKQGFTTLFGGLGGDELNAGEYEYFACHFADLKQAGFSAELDAEIDAWARFHDHPIYRKNAGVAHETIARIADLKVPGRVLPDEVRLRKYMKTVDPAYFDLSSFRPVMDAPFTSYLKNRTAQDMFRETLPCCLRAEDRQCTAAGLQHYDPFLDHELIEFMYRVPGSMKIRGGVTKQLLRDAMRGLLPEATRTRIAKVGWNAPAHLWFGGRNLSDLCDLVASQAFRQRGIYDVAEVDRLIAEHVAIVESGAVRENHMMFLWQLANLEMWLRAIPDFVAGSAREGVSI
ncbi:MAG: asparagine synthase-related protein, partial [Pseudomonadota bacterium]|nr:asparagine synthase-related protein [Pseudomonadota bacterium]